MQGDNNNRDNYGYRPTRGNQNNQNGYRPQNPQSQPNGSPQTRQSRPQSQPNHGGQPYRQGQNRPNQPRQGQPRPTQPRSETGAQTRVMNSVPANSTRSRSTALEPKKSSKLNYWKKVFALTESDVKESAIVREQGSYDYVFLVIVLVLLAFGTIMVYSSSYAYAKSRYGDSYYIIIRQAIFIVIGLAAMGFAMWFRPEWYKKFSWIIYAVCFFMLTLVPIPGIGVVKKGARRWIDLGFIDIQPSEFMKLGLVLMLAWYFDRYYERVTDYKNFWRSSFFGIFVPYAITGVTCIMIVIEKHLSGTVIMFMIGTILIFAGGGLKRWLFGLFGGGGLALFIVAISTGYTRRRLDLWLNPEGHEKDGAWQTLQGLYAIGSGGFFGVGIGESRQKHLYVSEPQNDFIFTIVCEELGFIGAVAVITLFMLFIYRGFVIAMKAPDTFSSLVVVGIVGKVALQALLNVAVVTNSLPNTGISLPFFSYGGSSLIILMVEMGIVLSISRFSKQKR